MTNDNINLRNFYSELAEYRIPDKEFFNTDFIKSLEKSFDFTNIVIFYFDKYNNFLSWRTRDNLVMDSPSHPYREFSKTDVVRYRAYHEAVRDKLNCSNTNPRISLKWLNNAN